MADIVLEDENDILESGKIHQKDYASGEKVIAWRDAARLPD